MGIPIVPARRPMRYKNIPKNVILLDFVLYATKFISTVPSKTAASTMLVYKIRFLLAFHSCLKVAFIFFSFPTLCAVSESLDVQLINVHTICLAKRSCISEQLNLSVVNKAYIVEHFLNVMNKMCAHNN